jgi:beta-lactamase class D
VGWVVGWVERPTGDVVYAMNLQARRDHGSGVRAELTRLLLQANGILPAGAASAATH